MTKEEAETVLYLVDQLRERGASIVEVAGIKAGWPVAPSPMPTREPRKKVKTYKEKLFGPLGIVKGKRG